MSPSLLADQTEPRHEKTNVLVSDLVRHKPGCSSTEDGLRLEISDLESRKIVLSKAKVTAKLICVFVFAYAKCWFSRDAAQIRSRSDATTTKK